ncbi:hypothetical protein [Mesorhizobium amorphae]|uniref:hypothetical protein n=1 Tax=Mesorhizobium amorphae TaxID=71433 RepID=UPI00177BCC76|nr:hypothetical protein [Mesorhizobium amorphae]
MPRYATIITDDDGQEIVSAIGEFEAAPQARAGRFESVPVGVLIGMVRGGPVDAVGGFGFPLGSQGAGDRAIGVAAIQKARAGLARADAVEPEATSTATLATAKPDTTRPARKPAKAKGRRKPGKAKAARSRQANTVKQPAGGLDGATHG